MAMAQLGAAATDAISDVLLLLVEQGLEEPESSKQIAQVVHRVSLRTVLTSRFQSTLRFCTASVCQCDRKRHEHGNTALSNAHNIQMRFDRRLQELTRSAATAVTATHDAGLGNQALLDEIAALKTRLIEQVCYLPQRQLQCVCRRVVPCRGY